MDREAVRCINPGSSQKRTAYKENVAVADHLTFAYPGSDPIFKEISFTAKPGQIVGITGPVACGKSTLGKSFLCEYPYEGHLTYGGRELSSYTENERSRIIGYLGHDPELLGDSVENNVLLGDDDNVWTWLRAVCFDEEVREMEEKEKTVVGNSGVRLSGGRRRVLRWREHSAMESRCWFWMIRSRRVGQKYRKTGI